MLYCKENESAYLNTLGPGPSAYETHTKTADKVRFGSRDKYTIGKVSIFSLIVGFNVILIN